MSDTGGFALRTVVLLLMAVVLGVLIAQLGGKIAVGGASAGGGPADVAEVAGYDGDVDRDSRQDILIVARATPYAVALGFGDEQSMQSSDDSTLAKGPHVRVEPVVAAHRYDTSELAAGRFLGRLVNYDPQPFARLGLGSLDTTYWWVDSAATGRWRSVFFSTDPAIQPVTMPVRLEASITWWQPVARWVTVGGIDALWATCGRETVCRTD